MMAVLLAVFARESFHTASTTPVHAMMLFMLCGCVFFLLRTVQKLGPDVLSWCCCCSRRIQCRRQGVYACGVCGVEVRYCVCMCVMMCAASFPGNRLLQYTQSIVASLFYSICSSSHHHCLFNFPISHPLTHTHRRYLPQLSCSSFVPHFTPCVNCSLCVRAASAGLI